MQVVGVHSEDSGRLRIAALGFLHGSKNEMFFQLRDRQVILRLVHTGRAILLRDGVG